MLATDLGDSITKDPSYFIDVYQKLLMPACVGGTISITEFGDIDDLAASPELYCTRLSAEVLPGCPLRGLLERH